jgi:hypothetical protein
MPVLKPIPAATAWCNGLTNLPQTPLIYISYVTENSYASRGKIRNLLVIPSKILKLLPSANFSLSETVRYLYFFDTSTNQPRMVWRLIAQTETAALQQH